MYRCILIAISIGLLAACEVSTPISEPDTSTLDALANSDSQQASDTRDTQEPSDTSPPRDTRLPEDSTPPSDTSLDTTTPNDTAVSDTVDVGGFEGTPCAVGSRAGTCEEAIACSGVNEPVPGYCPGPSNIQCCVERITDDPIGTACSTGTRDGVCQDASTCVGELEPVAGLCPGPSYVQCCVAIEGDPHSGTACTVGDKTGTCEDISACSLTSTPGYCPGPSNIQCCSEAPTTPGGETCDPAAMPRPNEGLVEAPGEGGCPSGMIPVAGFCIDRYEASLVELLSGGGEQSWSPYFNPGTRTMRAVSIAGAVPQGYINGRQAADACAASGKRLCTDTEWLRACRGPSDFTFPYGDTRQSGVCNDARAMHPAVEYFGSSESWVFSRIDHPCINQLENGLALTGDHPGCITVEGALDMMGNLHEWTAASSGIFRGGYYVDTVINGPGCLYRTTAHSTGHWDYSTGFRCCADAP